MHRETVKISTPFIRLASLLKLTGIAQTGGEGNIITADGLVEVNGEVCLQRGRKIRPGDNVVVDNSIIIEVDNENILG